MPARPRLSEEAWGKALEIVKKYPADPDVRALAHTCAAMHYGVELGMAYINRGITGDRARQLFNEYESARQWLDLTGQ